MTDERDVLGTLDAIVLGQTRFLKIERLCFQCSTVLPTKTGGGGYRGKGGGVSQITQTRPPSSAE